MQVSSKNLNSVLQLFFLNLGIFFVKIYGFVVFSKVKDLILQVSVLIFELLSYRIWLLQVLSEELVVNRQLINPFLETQHLSL